jgi:hypothetical protein
MTDTSGRRDLPGGRRWTWMLLLLVAAALVTGALAYNAGLDQGWALATVAATPNTGTPPVPPVPYGYYWHRPWGFGFLGPVLFVFFWIFVVRALLWGGPWRRGWSGPWASDRFDEWHRRAHERMDQPSRSGEQA